MSEAFKRAVGSVAQAAAVAALRHTLALANAAGAAKAPKGWRTAIVAENPHTGERFVVGFVSAETLRAFADETDGRG